jgi:aryl-alcohol dehydrogenase-like predicted oxidoreductase
MEEVRGATMERRTLGNSSLSISPLMLGGNVFGWTIDEPTSFEVLDAFVAAGFNAIDTADVYSKFKPGNQGGESETILGNWFASRGNRSGVMLASKCGMDMGQGTKGLTRTHILSAVEESLRRLQTDYIDLYMAHKDDHDTPMDETLEAFSQLLRQGKVRVIGASNFTADRLSEALATSKRLGLPRYESLQPNYNLYDRAEFEHGPQQLCVRENVGVIAYFSLASGFLTGKYRTEADLTRGVRGPRVAKYLNPRGLRVLDALDQVAERLNATSAQVALAWLMTRPGVTAPIVSATSTRQLADTLKSVTLKLDAAAMAALDAASAP